MNYQTDNTQTTCWKIFGMYKTKLTVGSLHNFGSSLKPSEIFCYLLWASLSLNLSYLKIFVPFWCQWFITPFSLKVVVSSWKILNGKAIFAKFRITWNVSEFGVFLVRIFSVSFRIQSKCGKVWNRKNRNTDAFHAVLDYKTAIIVLDITKPFQTIFWQLFRVWERYNGLNFMSQYQLSIPNKFHVDNKLFHNLMVRLWKCYQVTINNPQRYYAELKERWNNIVNLTS